MTETLSFGSPPLSVSLRRNRRARRMTLRVATSGAAVTVPFGTRNRDIVGFLSQNETWLRQRLQAVAPKPPIEPGDYLNFDGSRVEVVQASTTRPVLTDRTIALDFTDPNAGARLKKFCIDVARQRSRNYADHYSSLKKLEFEKISVRDPKTRWGSCSNKGRIMLSWRLIFSPPSVFRYVVAHEVAHLKEMNHSRAFWKTVEELYGDVAEPRRWLNKNGKELHRITF